MRVLWRAPPGADPSFDALRFAALTRRASPRSTPAGSCARRPGEETGGGCRVARSGEEGYKLVFLPERPRPRAAFSRCSREAGAVDAQDGPDAAPAAWAAYGDVSESLP